MVTEILTSPIAIFVLLIVVLAVNHFILYLFSEWSFRSHRFRRLPIEDLYFAEFITSLIILVLVFASLGISSGFENLFFGR